MNPISFCVPVYNEEKILVKFLNKIVYGLEKLVGDNAFEIVIVENGSTDNTNALLKNVKDKRIKIFHTKEKGLGIAYKTAIKKAKFNNVVLSAIDLPFGFSDIQSAEKQWQDYDILFGSKAHPKSVVLVSAKRKSISSVYRVIQKTLFGITIGDTQGSIFLKKNRVEKILHFCDAKNAFFTAQLAIFGKEKGLVLGEIPVKHVKENVQIRATRYNVWREGFFVLWAMLRDFYRVQKLSGS